MLTSLRRNITENKPSKEAIYDIIGIELSYKAGIFVRIYASTSDNSNQAHGHLRASMKQHFPLDSAKRGIKYEQILDRYNKGASIVRIKSRVDWALLDRGAASLQNSVND